MKKSITWEMEINGQLVAEIDCDLELVFDRYTNDVDVESIRVNVLGTNGKMQVEATGPLAAQIAAWFERKYADELPEIRAELRAGVVQHDREIHYEGRAA